MLRKSIYRYGEFNFGFHAHNTDSIRFNTISEVKEHFTPVSHVLFVYFGINFEFPQVFLPQKSNLDIRSMGEAANSYTLCYLHTHTQANNTIIYICLSHILPLAKNQLKQTFNRFCFISPRLETVVKFFSATLQNCLQRHCRKYNLFCLCTNKSNDTKHFTHPECKANFAA